MLYHSNIGHEMAQKDTNKGYAIFLLILHGPVLISLYLCIDII